MEQLTIKNQKPAGVLRRIAAMTYDALLLFAVLLLTLGLALAANGGEQLPLLASRTIVLLVIFGFFMFFWKRGGQTLGMQTWRLHLQSNDNSRIKLKHCALRLLGALLSFATFGFGYFWLWIDKKNRALPDIMSDTTLVFRPKEKKKRGDNPDK